MTIVTTKLSLSAENMVTLFKIKITTLLA